MKDIAVGIFQCESCFAHVAKCDHCDFIYCYQEKIICATGRRKCYNHVKACQRNMGQIIKESVEIQQNEETNNDSVAVDDFVLENSEWNDYNSFLVDIDDNEAMALTNESLRESQITYDGVLLPSFGVTETDQYIKMQVEMYHNYGEPFGGFRSVCWRSRYRSKLFQRDNIVSMEDAKFMFYVTKLNLEHTESMNDNFYRLLGAISQRWDINYMGHGVYVPTSAESADRYVLHGEYAIMDLLPRPKLCVWPWVAPSSSLLYPIQNLNETNNNLE